MATLSYKILHSGTEATLVFQSISHGEVRVAFKCINTPDGSKGLVYDCFNATIGRTMQQVSDENEFANDLSYIIYLYENHGFTDGDFLIGTFDAIIDKHIRQYNRIVDTDLYSTIAQMIIALNALVQKEPNGIPLNEHGKHNILEMLMIRAEEKYADFLYVTQYARTPFGLQPHLISFNDFKKNLK